MKFFICLIFIGTTALVPLLALAEDPIKVSTETEDLSLTDDLNIAKAQVEKYPENAEAHFNLAIALSRTSYVEEAIKELRKTKKLIRKEENAGLIERKINEYKETLKTNPEATSLNNIRYRLAFSNYLKAYYLSKEIERTSLKLAQTEANVKSSKKKKKQGLDLFTSDSLIKTKKTKDIEKALEESIFYFQEVLKYNPKDSWAKIYYAFILADQYNETDKAKMLWTEVVNDDPNNPAPHLFLGELKIKEGSLKEGILEITQAILLRSLGN